VSGIAAALLNYAPPDNKGDDHQCNDSFTPEADNRADGAIDPLQTKLRADSKTWLSTALPRDVRSNYGLACTTTDNTR